MPSPSGPSSSGWSPSRRLLGQRAGRASKTTPGVTSPDPSVSNSENSFSTASTERPCGPQAPPCPSCHRRPCRSRWDNSLLLRLSDHVSAGALELLQEICRSHDCRAGRTACRQHRGQAVVGSKLLLADLSIAVLVDTVIFWRVAVFSGANVSARASRNSFTLSSPVPSTSS